jgi:GH43 family beta-xylosidase
MMCVGVKTAMMENKAVVQEKTATQTSFNYPNPLIEYRADPQIARQADGWYTFTASVPEYDRIILRRAKTIGELATAEEKTLWTRPKVGRLGGYIWAPELHQIDGKWHIYFAAGDAEAKFNIRIYVLSTSSENPMEGEWKVDGQVKTKWESFALDSTTFVVGDKRYMCWAQHEDARGPGTSLYLDEMTSPTTLAGKQICIASPTLKWERIGHNVNEGPSVIVRNGRVWMTFSASATDANYCMGLLSAKEDSNLLDPTSWTKDPEPVMKSDVSVSQFGPGHNSFTIAEDGKTDLIVFHARNYEKIQGEPLFDPNRNTRVLELKWDDQGRPVFPQQRPDDHLTTKAPSVKR